MSNARFVANAPDDVVAKEREKIADAQSAFDKLSEQYAKIEQLQVARFSQPHKKPRSPESAVFFVDEPGAAGL